MRITLSGIVILIFVSISLYAQKENLGNNVNSLYPDESPIISPDGKTLYFARKDNPDNKGLWDIWYTTLDENGKWEKAKALDELNSSSSNFVCGITSDNNQLLLNGDFRNTGIPFMICSRTTNGWNKPKKIMIPNFSNKDQQRISYGTLCSDNKTIIFCTYGSESYGVSDIYVSFKQEDGTWSSLLNLGNQVNSTSSERFPSVAPDMKTLYFSSNKPGGLGGYDIYMSKRLDDSWTNWSKPINIGPNINTDERDIDFTVPAAGTYAYLVSSKNTIGNSDIFRVELAAEQRPESTLIVEGNAINKLNNKAIEATIRIEDISNGKLQAEAITNPGTGEFNFTLPAGKKYLINAEANGFFSQSESIDLTGLDSSYTTHKDIFLAPIEINSCFTLTNILFEVNKSEFLSESYAELDNFYQLLVDNPTIIIEISGHTDNTGTQNGNIQLSDDRAKAVANYFISKGIKPERLHAKGYGSFMPVQSNDTPEGRFKNRRVEIKIVSI